MQKTIFQSTTYGHKWNFNVYNAHVWCDEHPHVFNKKMSIILKWYIIENRLYGEYYLDFLRNTLQDDSS